MLYVQTIKYQLRWSYIMCIRNNYYRSINNKRVYAIEQVKL